MERRVFKIQRAPVAVLAIGVGPPLRKGGRDQPRSAGRPKIRNRAFDIRKRQMHQSVTAQDSVASRQRITGDIGEMIFALDFSRGDPGLQPLDQRRHDIDADGAHTWIAALIQPASPQGASSSDVTSSFSNSRGNSARSAAVASISEPSPEVDAAAPHKLVS